MSVSNEYYKIFYYVARYKSFNKAAKALMSSQPNITRVINNLEGELGCKLFKRTNQGVTLTTAGENLFKYAETAQKAIEEGEKVIRIFKDQYFREASIGISVGVSDIHIRHGILPGINSFTRSNPDVHLHIISDTTPNLINMVSEGSLNLAVVTSSKYEKPVGMKYVISTFRDIVVAGNDYRELFEGRIVSYNDLSKYPIISLLRGSETFNIHSDILARIGIAFNPTIEVPTMMHARVFAENNMGIACIDSAYALPSIEAGKLFEIKMSDGMPERTISLIKSDLEKNSAADNLENSIISEVIKASGQ